MRSIITHACAKDIYTHFGTSEFTFEDYKSICSPVKGNSMSPKGDIIILHRNGFICKAGDNKIRFVKTGNTSVKVVLNKDRFRLSNKAIYELSAVFEEYEEEFMEKHNVEISTYLLRN